MPRSIERTWAQLAAKDFSDMQKRDVVLQVTINFNFPELKNYKLRPISRRLRVSAGMKLSVFQDKVLAPAIGCTSTVDLVSFSICSHSYHGQTTWDPGDRNFHAYVFTVIPLCWHLRGIRNTSQHTSYLPVGFP